MGSSIKIKSISIDLAGTGNEIDMIKCDHFSIRGFVAEVRERDQRKCWPFSKESVSLLNQQSYSLPSLSVPKFRWWQCMSCIKDIDADHGTTKDNAVEEIEDVNYERSHKDGQRATAFLKKVHTQSMDASTVNSKSRKLGSPEQIGNKRCQEKVNKSSMDISMWQEKQIADQARTKNQKGISVSLECNNGTSESAMNELQGRKCRKVRLLSELLSKPNNKTSGGGSTIRKEEYGLKKESGRGRKRKLLPENNYASRVLSTENASRSCDSDGESTDSGFDRTPIKGKQRNRRFQVVDEFVPSLPCEILQKSIKEHDADLSDKSIPVHSKDLVFCPPSTQRTESKLSLAKKKTKKHVLDNEKSTLISFSSSIDGHQINSQTGPSINAALLENRLASEGYFRKCVPHVNDKYIASLHFQDIDHVRSRDAEPTCLGDFSSCSKSSTVGWLRNGVDVVDFSNNINNTNELSFSNFKLRQIPSSTEVADLSLVLQKDASGADTHGATRSQSHDRKGNMTEEQNDDIPMEIVELMAKNQYERCLPDKEEDFSNKQPSHKSKNALLIDLNETYDNGNSLEDNNNISRPPKPYGTNARREEHCSYVPSPFGIFPQTQENEASSIKFSGHNSEWLRNFPTVANQNPSPSSIRVLRACDTCQSAPIQYKEDSHPIWSSSMIPPQSHHKPAGMLPQASNNEHKWNLNFVAAKGNPNPISELSFGCKHAAGVSGRQQSTDTFSSESFIPAMHLLSLMDPRLRSNSTADQHENTNYTKRNLSPVQTGDSSKTAYSTSQLPLDFNNKRFSDQTSQIIPPLGTSSLSLQNAQASRSPHQDKNTMRKDSSAPVYNTHEKTVSARSNDQAKFQLLGASNSMMLPLKFHMTNKEKKQKRRAEICNNASSKPVKKSSGLIVCNINRNPADFTIPEPGNVYMLTGEHLKIRKKHNLQEKTSLCQQDVMKQTKKPVCSATENV